MKPFRHGCWTAVVGTATALLALASGCQRAADTPARRAAHADSLTTTAVRSDAPAPAPAVLAGSSVCRECHEDFYRLWAPSHHGLAMQPYTAAFAAAELKLHDGEIKVGQETYRAKVGPDQGWVLEHGPQGERKLPIAHVLGGKNVYYFLTPWERGRLQTLPVAYDVKQQVWFDTARSGVRHFPDRDNDSPLHWTEREYTFNTSCYSCHVSQLSVNYHLQSDTYHTAWAEPGINCETCHGPAAEHVKVCRAAAGETPPDLKIIVTKTFNVEQTNTMCAPCHAKMIPVSGSFLPGERYFDHFDLMTLEHPDFYPDGRDLGENYTMTGWRMSPCVQSDQLDCMHCHTSSGRFRFVDNPNQSCLPCHQELVDNATAHSHHAADSKGNSCIACHMPLTRFANMSRSDHSMLPPTPAASLQFKSPNACNICHTEQDDAWSENWVRQWYASDYQAPVLHRAGLIDAARKGDWSRFSEMRDYLARPDRDEIFATGLIRLLRSNPGAATRGVFVQALRDASPLVRGAAAEALGGQLTPETVPGLLAACADEYRLVRVRAAAALAALPREPLDAPTRQALDRATDEFFTAMLTRPDDHTSHHNLGAYYTERGDLQRAVECYSLAHRLDPRAIPPLVNVSVVYSQLGQNDRAEQSLRQALRLEPTNPAANLNLGMLLGELGRMAEAEQAFRTALQADPQSAAAAYNLGVVLSQRDVSQAIELCRTADRLRPDEPKYAFAVASYLQQEGQIDQAIQELRQLQQRHPGFAHAYGLLGSLLVDRGRTAEAVQVYQQAAANSQLPDQARRFFQQQAQALSGSP